MSALYPPVEKDKLVPEPDMEYVVHEMKKKDVKLMLLWEEYKEKHPDGIMYTQFCERYKKFKISNKLTMHIEHKDGEEMQADWAGTALSYTNCFAGDVVEEYIKQVLKSRDFPQQTFRTCMGIMRLGEDCDAVQMEAACEEALKKRIYTYKYFSNILKQILQKGISNKSKNDIIIKHINLRGSKVYEGGGIHAN